MKIANQNKIASVVRQKKSTSTTTFAPLYGGICLFRRRLIGSTYVILVEKCWPPSYKSYTYLMMYLRIVLLSLCMFIIYLYFQLNTYEPLQYSLLRRIYNTCLRHQRRTNLGLDCDLVRIVFHYYWPGEGYHIYVL